MEISENDLWTLSYYRESELHGALIMGRLARETDNDELRVHLTEHCAEEAHHAWLWTQAILAVGGAPKRVTETYQSRYHAAIGHPTSLLEILVLTQVFERRVMRHFRAHLRSPENHPVVTATLEKMIADEVGHIGWVKDWLDRYALEHGEPAVAETMRRFEEVDRQVYGELLRHRDRVGELLSRGVSGDGADEAGSFTSQMRRLAAKTLGISEAKIRDDASLRDVGINSLDLVVLVMALEEAFRIELEPKDLEGIKTFSDLVRRVGELRAVRV
jgi:acyl carrier protein